MKEFLRHLIRAISGSLSSFSFTLNQIFPQNNHPSESIFPFNPHKNPIILLKNSTQSTPLKLIIFHQNLRKIAQNRKKRIP